MSEVTRKHTVIYRDLCLFKLFKLTGIPVHSQSFPKLDRPNHNVHFFLGRTCIPLEPADTALIAAGGVVVVPAHHQLTPQVNRRVPINERRSAEREPSSGAVRGVVRGVGRILHTPGRRENRLAVVTRNSIALLLCNVFCV